MAQGKNTHNINIAKKKVISFKIHYSRYQKYINMLKPSEIEDHHQETIEQKRKEKSFHKKKRKSVLVSCLSKDMNMVKK